MRSVLAFDLGTTTGWARSVDGVYVFGHLSLKGGRYEGGGMRFLRFREHLEELSLTAPVLELVVFEEVRRHLGVDAAHIYGGLMATLTAFCEQAGIPYQGVPVGTIKKHATGKGNAPKAAMVEAAQRILKVRALGFDYGTKAGHIHSISEDEADAVCLLDYQLSTRAA